MTSPYSELILYTTRDDRGAMECMRCTGPEENIIVQRDSDHCVCVADYITAADRHNARYHPNLVTSKES